MPQTEHFFKITLKIDPILLFKMIMTFFLDFDAPFRVTLGDFDGRNKNLVGWELTPDGAI